MKVIFIRHAGLKYPYNNYDRLSLEQLDSLATGTVQPHINTRVAKAKIKKHIEDGFLVKNEVDAIYYSPTPRAEETAMILAGLLTAPKREELSCLKEITFSPKKLVTKNTFEHQGMNAVRKALYRAIEQGVADESISTLLERIHRVQDLIVSDSNRTIVIVTHGFFMRLLQIVLLHDTSTFSVKDQQQAVNYDYLQGFSYVLEKNTD